MRKHVYKQDKKYNVMYRPLTVSEVTDGDFIQGDNKLFKHQKEYLRLMALLDSIAQEGFKARIKCPDCGEYIEFDVQRNAIQVVESKDKTYNCDSFGVRVRPYITGKEEIHELIDAVIIDGDLLRWEECTDVEKESVLDAIDYATYKSILTDLEEPVVVSYIPVRCSCGYEHVVSLKGLHAFIKLM